MRSKLLPSLVRRVALWPPSTVAIASTVVFLVAHELAYHLTASVPDFPLMLLVDDTSVFAISHGGLDAIGVGLVIVSVLWLVEAARIHEGRPR